MTVATRGLLLALLGLASVAVLVADVKITQVTVVSLYQGTTKLSDWPSWDACLAQAVALATADPRTSGTVTRTCKTEVRNVVAVYSPGPPPPPPPPGPLAISCPAPVAVATGPGPVTFPVAATTGGSAPVTVVAMPASGSAFPLGATTVTETATDALGVMAVCTFTVTVTAPPPPPPPGTSIVLEDFSGPMKQNGDSPPSPLWSPYNDSSSPSQTGGIVNGAYVLTVPSGNIPDFQFLPYPYVAPKGFAKSYLTSGTWNANVNRLSFWVKTGARVSRDPSGSSNLEIGTYTKAPDNQPNNQGRHFYHQYDLNLYPGRWVKFVLNRHPQHEVSDPGGTVYPENPTAPGWNYFDGLTRFYYGYAYQSPALWGNTTYTFDDFLFDQVAGEPDDAVASLALQYTGTRYEAVWASQPNSSQVYSVHYSPTSMKAAGFAAGTDGGTTQATGSTYLGVFWASPAMTEVPGGLYVAIQPQGRTTFTEVYLPVRP